MPGLTIQKFARAAAAAALGVGLVAGGATAANADVDERRVVNVNGEWKALATYDEGRNLVCVRAYNSLLSAYAVVYLTVDGERFQRTDYGGDRVRHCRFLPSRLEGERLFWKVLHHSARGDINGDEYYWVDAGEV